MTDTTTGPAPIETYITPPPAALDAETQANIATARDLHHTLGQDLESVAHWLVAQTRGAIADVAAAIKHIL